MITCLVWAAARLSFATTSISYPLGRCPGQSRSGSPAFSRPPVRGTFRALGQVSNVTFRDLAIDGNRDNQPLLYTKSNHGLVADPFQSLSVAAVAGASSLTAGTYQFFVTYTDVNGVETNVLAGAPGTAVIAPGEFARISLPPTPNGAVQVYAYISESEFDAYGADRIYERQGPFAIPGGSVQICGVKYSGGGILDINSHLPGNLYPPGYGLHTAPGEVATGAISIDSDSVNGTSPTSNIVVDNCDIGNMASDAITVIGFVQSIRVANCNFHDAGLCGINSAADVLSGLYVTDTEFSGCDVGTDFEDDAVNLVRYLRCSFNNCHSCGLSIGTLHLLPQTSDFVIDTCQFGDISPNGTNLQAISSDDFRRADSIHIKSCHFGYAIAVPVHITVSGGGTIEDCFFDQASRPFCYNPAIYGLQDTGQLLFDGGQSGVGDIGPAGSNWQVLGCTFKPFADASNPTLQPCIDAVNGARNILVSGCIYLHNDGPPEGPPWPTPPRNILFNSDVIGGLANHRFAGNYGFLGEAGLAAAGYPIGAGDTSIAVVFPFPQATPQYEACPQFGWDSGNWWVTGKTAAGYTLHWKNAPSVATQLPITIRDAQA